MRPGLWQSVAVVLQVRVLTKHHAAECVHILLCPHTVWPHVLTSHRLRQHSHSAAVADERLQQLIPGLLEQETGCVLLITQETHLALRILYTHMHHMHQGACS